MFCSLIGCLKKYSDNRKSATVIIVNCIVYSVRELDAEQVQPAGQGLANSQLNTHNSQKLKEL